MMLVFSDLRGSNIFHPLFVLKLQSMILFNFLRVINFIGYLKLKEKVANIIYSDINGGVFLI